MEKKISRLDTDSVTTTTPDVRAFEMRDLSGTAGAIFRTPTLEAKRVPLPAQNDDARPKDRRFHVDPVLRDLLAVDDETDAEIESRVERRVAEIAEQSRTESRERGYEEGYAHGLSEAKATFEATARERLAQIETLVAGFEASKAAVFSANERFLVELVFKIAGSVLQREILIDPEYLARVVRSIVEKVGAREQLKLIANAAQIETLYGMLPELERKYASLKNISIEASSQLGEADVVVETDWSRVDASFDSQLGSLHEVVLAALEESVARPDGSAESA